jgi:hypothetical protein
VVKSGPEVTGKISFESLSASPRIADHSFYLDFFIQEKFLRYYLGKHPRRTYNRGAL